MPDSRVIPTSRAKSALLLLGSIGFVALGVWMSGDKPVLGWVCAGFFALGIPVSLAMLLTDKFSLRLDAEGLEMASPINTTRIRWQDIARFELGQIKGARMIAIRYREHYRGQRLGRQVAEAMAGMEGAIPNNYAMPLPELLAELRKWHARHAGPEA